MTAVCSAQCCMRHRPTIKVQYLNPLSRQVHLVQLLNSVCSYSTQMYSPFYGNNLRAYTATSYHSFDMLIRQVYRATC